MHRPFYSNDEVIMLAGMEVPQTAQPEIHKLVQVCKKEGIGSLILDMGASPGGYLECVTVRREDDIPQAFNVYGREPSTENTVEHSVWELCKKAKFLS
jgi:C-terminal processing protease CtpA/Prc